MESLDQHQGLIWDGSDEKPSSASTGCPHPAAHILLTAWSIPRAGMEQIPARTHVQPCTGPYGRAGIHVEVREQWNALLVPLGRSTSELQHPALSLGSHFNSMKPKNREEI